MPKKLSLETTAPIVPVCDIVGGADVGREKITMLFKQIKQCFVKSFVHVGARRLQTLAIDKHDQGTSGSRAHDDAKQSSEMTELVT